MIPAPQPPWAGAAQQQHAPARREGAFAVGAFVGALACIGLVAAVLFWVGTPQLDRGARFVGSGFAAPGGFAGRAGTLAAAPLPPRPRSSASALRMQHADFYQTLGVPRTASDSDIKGAFRKLARQWHPDVNDSPGAKEKFQEIAEAYQVLSDQKMRQRYDQFGVAGVRGPGGAGPGPGMQDVSLDDILSSIFGGGFGDVGFGGGGFGGFGGQRRSRPTQGDDLRVDVDIDFQTGLFGGEKNIRVTRQRDCSVCSGSGVAPGVPVKTCKTCGGSGMETRTVRTFVGSLRTQATCSTCGGSGKIVEEYCKSCRGKGMVQEIKGLTITIPPGVEDGNRLRVRGEGDAGRKGGATGDIYVFLKIKGDSRFRREGMDIYSDVKVSYLDAILGKSISVPTVDGEVALDIPAGTQPGAVFRIPGRGAPKLNDAATRGTHHVTCLVEIPRKVSNKEREILGQLKSKR